MINEYIKPNQAKEYVKTISTTINPKDNGGESVVIEVDIFDNGDTKNNIYNNTHIQTNCYGTHSTTLSFHGLQFEDILEAVNRIQEQIRSSK